TSEPDQSRVDSFFRQPRLRRQFLYAGPVSIFAFEQPAILRRKLAQALIQLSAKAVVRIGQRMWSARPGPEGKFFQQSPVALLFASGIPSGTAGQGLEPAPERLSGIEHARVADKAQECLLERLLGFFLVAMTDNEQKLIKAIEISCMELRER